jgi:dTDP-4-dehydrorhamnose reductase
VRALVTGAEGQLGRALVRQLGPSLVAGLGRGQLDLCDHEALARACDALRPDVIFNAAAYNAVDRAESDAAAAFAVNAVAPAHLARLAREHGALLVHVSTDYVFDGRNTSPYHEDARPAPLSVYGASKAAGELAVAAADGVHLIVRTSAVLGAGASRAKGGSFVERILARARAGEPLRVVDDQVFAPTYAPDLAAALVELVERGARGLMHVTNAGTCTWHELACATLRCAGLTCEVARVATHDLKLPARRPAYSVLANTRAAALGLQAPRPWQEALAELIATLV